jgi:hypothetical protein
MEDRNPLGDPTWRRIFCVFDVDYVIIFDEHGSRIHEPDDGIEDGKQVAAGEQGFLADWSTGYYRAGVPPGIVADLDDDEAEPRGSPPRAVSPPRMQDTTIEELTRVGARLQECFGMDTSDTTGAWYGGVVGEVTPSGQIPYGFDDGELCVQWRAELQGLLDLNKLSLCTDSQLWTRQGRAHAMACCCPKLHAIRQSMDAGWCPTHY